MILSISKDYFHFDGNQKYIFLLLTYSKKILRKINIKQRNDDHRYSGPHNLHIQDKNNYFYGKIWCKEIEAKYCKSKYIQRKPTFIGSNKHIVKSNVKRLNHVYIEIWINTSTPNLSNNQFSDNIEELQQWFLGIIIMPRFYTWIEVTQPRDFCYTCE